MKEKKWWRMLRILSFGITVIFLIYWYNLRKKSDNEWEELWSAIGRRFRNLLFELEGLLIKVGQMLSIRRNLFPEGFIGQIQDLVDHVPPSPWPEIQQVLEREWKGPIQEKLESIETKAVASASIGEVYRAKMKDGTTVAIKVKRPTIKAIMKTDFRSLAIVLWLVRHLAPIPKGFINFQLLFDELKLVIERELDFIAELETINRFRTRFESVDRLKIPKVYPELSTASVLVMEWVEGERITNTEFLDQSGIDRGELAERLMRLFMPQWLEPGVFHADPHAGNVLIDGNGTIILLDFGMVGEISKNDAARFQKLVHAVLLNDYAQAVGVLGELGFLLPGADVKKVETLLEEAITFDLEEYKNKDLFEVKKEITEIIKSLPIQVPTRFIFLGRSVGTMEGILQTVNPDRDILEIAKPVFKDWLNQSGNGAKWRWIMNWVSAQPFFQTVHSLLGLLHLPEQLAEQQETLQKREFHFSLYENRKKHSGFTAIAGMAGLYAGIYLQDIVLWGPSTVITGLAIIIYANASRKQKKWMKAIGYQNER